MTDSSEKAPEEEKGVKEKEIKPMLDFIDENIIKDFDFKYKVINGSVYGLKKDMPDMKGLRVLRSGLFMGEIKKDRFELAGFETVWLSPTPHEYGSRFLDASPYPRLCVMVHLREKETYQEFRVYNTHLDHRSEEARNKGLKIILDFIELQENKKALPSILMGDFNAQRDSNTIEMCSKFTELTTGIGDTFHDFGRRVGYGQIDYMFAIGKVKKIATEKWQDCHDGIYLSDHYPVCTQVEME